MSSNKFRVPVKTDIDEAEIDGYTDGFIDKDKASFKYIGRDILFSAYIKAKSQGALDRVKAKNRHIKSKYRETDDE